MKHPHSMAPNRSKSPMKNHGFKGCFIVGGRTRFVDHQTDENSLYG